MRKLSSDWKIALCATLAFGCGGASGTAASSDKQTTPEPVAESSTARGSSAGTATSAEELAPITEPARQPAAEATPEPAAEPGEAERAEAAQAVTHAAKTDLVSTRGKKSVGTMSLEQKGDRVLLVGSFSDLPPGVRGLQIRAGGKCNRRVVRGSAEHFNPTDAKHGPPASPERHAGDFGNLTVDKDGNATFKMETDSITVAKGPNSVVGRSLVVTARKDDGKTQPHGKAGKAIACGVIHPDTGEVRTSRIEY